MAMSILRNFTWWVNGFSQHLEIEELTPPAIKDKLEAVRIGPFEVDVPLGLEKLEAKVSMFTRNADIMVQMGIGPGLRLQSTFRGQTVDELDGTSHTEIIVMQHRVSGEAKAWKSGDKSGLEYTLNSILYYKHTIDARPIHELDPTNVVGIVNGVDHWRPIREALGMGF
jgi:P2 family phage contractile tail tube protein